MLTIFRNTLPPSSVCHVWIFQLHVHLFIIFHHLKLLTKCLLQLSECTIIMFSQKNWSHFKIIFQKENVNRFTMYFSLVSPLVFIIALNTRTCELGWVSLTYGGYGRCFLTCYLLGFIIVALFATCGTQMGNDVLPMVTKRNTLFPPTSKTITPLYDIG
jgi:hypothetical protein